MKRRKLGFEERNFIRDPNVRCGKLTLRGRRLTPLEIVSMGFWFGYDRMLVEYGLTKRQGKICWKWAASILEKHIKVKGAN